MKKTLTLVVLSGLLLTGCSGKAAGNATAVAAVADAVTVPGVMGMTLDRATDQLEDLGLKVEAVDTVDGKSIIVDKNWQVTSQDPAEGASVAKGSTVHLGVGKAADKAAEDQAAADKAAAEKAAAEAAAAAKAAAEKAAADQAAAQLVAEQAAAQKAAAEQAAAQQAAAQTAAQQAAKPAPAPVAPAPAAPAAAYFGSCAEAKAAGAAPLFAGQAGYRPALDRDKDGVACES
ncbi:excalibur calcium-binding domain-containing protein [Pseudarthrobacter sp. NPDC055928]|uniref:excalibur calcium-binding domain-containing protein n=1 Tax=Pseudarthrobacter sp. NPDC055928 TaxID=3345661 RepID=UPI0035E27EF4